MIKPYLLWSDSHFHNWSAFANESEEGMNSRLKIQIQQAQRAYSMLRDAGGTQAIHAGDLFHVRGSLKPSVLNAVNEFFRETTDLDHETCILSGNHDLETNVSKSLTSAVSAVRREGVEPVNYVAAFPETRTIMVPWHPTIDSLLETIEGVIEAERDHSYYDLIIHAPVNEVLINIPNTGLNAEVLADLGFHRVFAGHYHNHKSFCDDRVYSIGALCHQTWGDVGSAAGFMLVWPNKVEFVPSSAPEFVRWQDGDDLEVVRGNYVRADLEDPTPGRQNDLRNMLLEAGAAGVTIRSVIKTASVRKKGAVTAMDSLGESIYKYSTAHYDEDVADICSDIFKEVSEL